MTDIVERLRSGTVQHRKRWSGDTHADLGGSCNEAETDRLLAEAADEIERLRAALRPFSTLFLYPDDLGSEQARDIREDQDWCEDANDMQADDHFILRRHIKAARAALGEGGEK